MSKENAEKAFKYYPLLWDIHRIKALVQAGKLTKEEADLILKGIKPY